MRPSPRLEYAQHCGALSGSYSWTTPKEDSIASENQYIFGLPRLEDAGAIWRLVKEIGVLDINSSYCYLVLCKHFAETCVIARQGERLAGFVTAMILPTDATRLFVWQVGVSEIDRGQGLAKRMLLNLLARPVCRGVTHIETTVAPSNIPSNYLFSSLARDLDTQLQACETYGPELFTEPGHEPEQRLLLGPFRAPSIQPS